MNKELLSVDEVVYLINQKCDRLGQQKLYAERVGISQEYLSKILSGKENPAHKILENLGLVKVVMYARKKAD
jgi:transcriptional regulator with XRE-family HTH domain